MQDGRRERNGRGCRTEREGAMERDAGLKEREKWTGMKERKRRGLEEDEGWRKRTGRG